MFTQSRKPKRRACGVARSLLALAALSSVTCAAFAPAALAQAGTAGGVARPQPTPQAAGQSVSVLLTAVDKQNNFVTTLGHTDVRIVEDGVARDVLELRRQDDLPLFLAVVVDTSFSQEGVLGGSKLAADVFVKGMMRPGVDRAAVVTFAHEATLEQSMTGDVGRVRGAIMLIKPTAPPGMLGGIIVAGSPPPRGSNLPGATALWDAVWTVASDVLPRSLGNGRRALILITDGVDTGSRLKMEDAVRSALGSEAVIYVIGVGSKNYDVDKDALRKLAERTGGRAFFPKKVHDLPPIFTRIQQELLSQYVLTFAPARPAGDGSFHKLAVEIVNPELRKRDLKLSFPHGYFAGNAPTAVSPQR